METAEKTIASTDNPSAVSMSPSTSLLACPFCGGAATIKHIGNDYGKKQVCEIACTTFGCFAHQRVGILNGRGHTYEWAEQKCRERWNTRHANAQISGGTSSAESDC